MRIMGLDVGDKTIGVAISDELCMTAQGIGVILRKNPENDLEQLMKIVNENDIQEIVLGLPKNMNGSIGDRAEKIMRFGETIKERLEKPIIFWDERLTTIMAERTLIEADVSRKKRKRVIDKMAAILILQCYLDSKR